MPETPSGTRTQRRRRRQLPAGPPVIHIFNPLWDASGGSEWSAVGLFRELEATGRCRPMLWSEEKVDPYFARNFPVHRIRFPFRYPRRGIFVFVGVYFSVGRWFDWARPERTIVRFNTPNTDLLEFRLRRLTLGGMRPVELVYPSQLSKETAGLPGLVDPVPLDLQRFCPRTEQPYCRPEGFVVGRLSRDVSEKHHADDPELYRRIVAAGGRVRVLGGTCMAGKAGGVPGIELRPACSEDAGDFLRSLDCFFYRTDPSWLEPFGRIVPEAMACGLPVVCERRGGYSEWVRHGESGFLFDTQEEAWKQLMHLKEDLELRESIGRAAFESIQDRFRADRRQAVVDYYIGR